MRASLLGAALALVGVTVALAASGGLDTTFHGTGKVKLDVVAGQYNDARGLAIQSDGKIVTVGDTWSSTTSSNIALVRFTKTGGLDPAFSGTGKKVINLGGLDQGQGVVIQPTTGKIVVAGQKCDSEGFNCDLVVLRLNPNGSLDTSFNGSGKRIDDFEGGDNGTFGAVMLQPDGKIVVGGYMFKTSSNSYEMAVYRYTSAGALDATFNGTGKKSIEFGAGRNEYVQGIAYQPTGGKIILVGSTCDSAEANCNFAIARLNANGSLDTSFSVDGRQTTDFGASETAYGVSLQSGGKIMVAGGKDTASAHYWTFARYTSNGSLDTTFAGTGKKILDFSGTGDGNARSVRVQPSNGKIVACGNGAGAFALVRLTAAGALDTTFHGTGKTTVDFGGDDVCRALSIQPADGKYVLAGYSYDGAKRHWAVARILP